ncbi:hypothetical protein [Pseudoxanthomonas dokdonensis]|uniref:Thioredoxin domain-containing protein n=1 Tax=Pseudoxanthomonas dokdonensis TaxID=344882 RepID=A0A0R0CQ48_9GAMM|nr:hypothetical protein [Pseudoxanthomonas dokdonensis]KRG68362.1 hypothetical protein ABB29_13675 [Pseudoxanthomonas dokdonensis]
MNSSIPDPARTRRGRWMLVALFVLFFGSMAGAGVLRFAGWQPAGHKNHGQLLQPPADVRLLRPMQQDGSPYSWRVEQRIWRIVAAPPAGCGADCDTLARDLDTVWRLFGHNADKVEILWLGPWPASARKPDSLHLLASDDALRSALPAVDDPAGVPVYVIDPNGFVILRYAPGFDPADLRTDVAKLLKLI